MIFNNSIAAGEQITATKWNRAFGFNGTARSLYEGIGSQQHATQFYNAGSFGNSRQTVTALTTVQFSFLSSTYITSKRFGDFIVWNNNYITTDNLRDGLVVQRNGIYAVHCEAAINDNVNRIGNTASTDGIGAIPNVVMTLNINKQSQSVAVVTNTTGRITNTIKQETGTTAPNIQPYYAAYLNTIATLNSGDRIYISTALNSYAGRNERLVYGALKLFLLKAL
jgi:hypothetical protein